MVRILVKDSTDGLGLEAARQLVQSNHTIYFHTRSQERTDDAKAKCPGAAGVLIADLTSVTETRKLAEEANAIGTFDGVILNAGLLSGPFRKTPGQRLTGVYFEPNGKIGEPLAVTADENLQEVVVKSCEDVTALKLVA